MSKWVIPVTWEMFGTLEVEADTLEEAMSIAVTDDDIELPEDQYYVDGSISLSMPEEENIRKYYNNNNF